MLLALLALCLEGGLRCRDGVGVPLVFRLEDPRCGLARVGLRKFGFLVLFLMFVLFIALLMDLCTNENAQ